ncbi:methyl-accepting chemotaxis protein [Sedimenticola sp.]|uniref:methyl-accepting chemotaxis protein n=2 Tax=Sedimenticola sp. TaxID=1940285 RepID=UPI003D13D167
MTLFGNGEQKKRLIALEEENTRLSREIEHYKTELAAQSDEMVRLRSTAGGEAQLDSLMRYENENIKLGLVDIQGNLAESVGAAKHSLSGFGEINSEFSTLSSHIQSITSDLDSLSKVSAESGESVAGMSSRAGEISSILALIKGIAEQTNLLALNAAIEAARAGEQGRGFAVVADEVRGLADKTQSAITEINDVIQAMQDNVKSVSAASVQVIEKVEKVSTAVNGFQQDLGKMGGGVQSYFNDVTLMTDSVFLSLAKLDHVLWKVNTYLSVNMNEPAFNFVDHHNCRLGKWYYEGEGKEYFSHSNHYGQIEQPHSVVHQGTKGVFELLGGEQRNYPALMQAFHVMEESSQKVFAMLDKVEEDAKRVAG